ncbi:MAG: OmpA family protein [Flavobacteriales bacterium]|nr:OmpA family protein [Flavobacteriales bacterium]MBK7553396.1 OmpA family protein [Flavobacteriales bacterium]MBP6574009.1 OmpA family protein [Flavobacteriales bacterium]
MQRSFHSVLVAALLLTVTPAFSQSILQRTLSADTMPNLLPDGGFEQHERLYCAWTQEAEKFSKNMTWWDSPTETTPDLFDTGNEASCWSHPGKRTDGKASPHSGTSMIGIKTWGKGNTPTHWHEYVQTELPQPLEAGKRYIAEFWVMRASFCNEASNNIGMLVTNTPVKTRDCLPLYFTPTINEKDVVKRTAWKKVSGVFDAKGDEQFIILGNFYSDMRTGHERQPEGERGAYYFIDDVNIRIAPPGTALTDKPTESIPPPPKKKVEDHVSTKEVEIHEVEPEVGRIIRLDKIYFDFDKSVLKPESEAELNTVVELLTDYPHMRIEISAHTDDQGSDDYNNKLSQARAKAVVDYLIAKKVDTSRLIAKGYGETKPIATNADEPGRALNRRVEFEVLER